MIYLRNFNFIHTNHQLTIHLSPSVLQTNTPMSTESDSNNHDKKLILSVNLFCWPAYEITYRYDTVCQFNEIRAISHYIIYIFIGGIHVCTCLCACVLQPLTWVNMQRHLTDFQFHIFTVPCCVMWSALLDIFMQINAKCGHTHSR